jgi:hypothetical protein
MTVEGPRKGEPSTKTMRYGLRTQPAPLVRGSSRRIMSMRFRPANISVINRRDSSEPVIGPAVQNPCSKLTSGIMFPLRRPSKPFYVPERCSRSRVHFAAPNYGAPLTAARRSGQLVIATGGSGGNMTQSRATKNQSLGPLKRLDRSLHISFQPNGDWECQTKKSDRGAEERRSQHQFLPGVRLEGLDHRRRPGGRHWGMEHRR